MEKPTGETLDDMDCRPLRHDSPCQTSPRLERLIAERKAAMGKGSAAKPARA